MPKYSRYVLVVDNISSTTPSRDIEREFTYFGRVRDCVKDSKARCCLVEFEKSLDCQAAWKKMDGFNMDGRAWKVDYANRDDFKFFGWKWFEHSPSPPPRSRSPVRGRSRSPDTPYQDDDTKRTQSRSPNRRAAAGRSPARD